MNAITLLWEGLNTVLNANKEALGIRSVECAEPGQLRVTTPPGVATWLEFDQAQVVSNGKAYSMDVVIAVACIASAKPSRHEAIYEAITIAKNVIDLLSGRTIENCVLMLDGDERVMEIVASKANLSIVGVQFTAQVLLT